MKGKQQARNDRRASYRVWRVPEKDYDQNEQLAADNGWDYGALDEKCAAEYHASIFHSKYDGWEATWPVTFRVKNLATGKMFDIEVERHTVPEFEAGKIVEVRRG